MKHMPDWMRIRDALKSDAFARKLNAAFRGRLQEWEAVSSELSYGLRGRILGVAAPRTEELGETLRSRLARRRATRPARRKGDLHIFVAYGLTNWEDVLPRALAAFGSVTSFEWRARGFDDSSTDWVSCREAMNRELLHAFDEANRQTPVDAFVGYLSGHNTNPEMLLAIAERGSAVFNFCLDDKLGFPGRKLGGRYPSAAALAQAVDLNLTNAPSSIIKYAVHGGLAMFFPEAAHPELHRPYDVPRDINVSFVGGCYGLRPRFIRELEKRGAHVECFGAGWPNGPLSEQERIKLYSRSRISLGFAGIGYSRKLTCLKGRDFEVPMSSGLYLTQDSSELRLVFDVDTEVVTYRREDDCAESIRRLLADPERAKRIRLAGRARCLQDHTYEARWSRVFKLAGLLSMDDSNEPIP
jgi:hypothetical protein